MRPQNVLTDGVGVGSACSQPGQPSQRHQRAARHSLTRRGLREQRAGAAAARAPSLMHLLPRSPRNQHPSASTRCLHLLLLPARAPCRSPRPFHTLPSITVAACTSALPEPVTVPAITLELDDWIYKRMLGAVVTPKAAEARHSFPRDCGDGTPPSASLARPRSLYTTPPRPEAEFCACSPASGPRAADGEPAALQDWRLLGRRACLRSPPPGCPCGHPDVQLETVVPMYIPRAGCQGPRRHALESEPSALACGRSRRNEE